MTREQKRNALKVYLKGEARKLYDLIPLDERKNYDKLKGYLRAFYLPPQDVVKAKIELQRMMQQPNEKIAEFIARLRSKARIAYPSDRHLTSKAVHDELKAALAYRSSKPLRRKLCKLYAKGAPLDEMIEAGREEEVFYIIQ